VPTTAAKATASATTRPTARMALMARDTTAARRLR
jgi:hypothetical protein